jgi:hypothetical protein
VGRWRYAVVVFEPAAGRVERDGAASQVGRRRTRRPTAPATLLTAFRASAPRLPEPAAGRCGWAAAKQAALDAAAAPPATARRPACICRDAGRRRGWDEGAALPAGQQRGNSCSGFPARKRQDSVGGTGPLGAGPRPEGGRRGAVAARRGGPVGVGAAGRGGGAGLQFPCCRITELRGRRVRCAGTQHQRSTIL